jgi:hypothetical protein
LEIQRLAGRNIIIKQSIKQIKLKVNQTRRYFLLVLPNYLLMLSTMGFETGVFKRHSLHLRNHEPSAVPAWRE